MRNGDDHDDEDDIMIMVAIKVMCGSGDDV